MSESEYSLSSYWQLRSLCHWPVRSRVHPQCIFLRKRDRIPYMQNEQWKEWTSTNRCTDGIIYHIYPTPNFYLTTDVPTVKFSFILIFFSPKNLPTSNFANKYGSNTKTRSNQQFMAQQQSLYMTNVEQKTAQNRSSRGQLQIKTDQAENMLQI